MSAAHLALRPYQREAIDAVRKAWKNGTNRPAIILPTGSGKTIVASHLIEEELTSGGRALFLAHREELVDQAAEKIRAVTSGLRVGIEMANRKADLSCDVVVGSVPTLASGRRIARWPRDAFTKVIVDECFPAGTRVGTRAIESLRPGDLVPSWNEEEGRTEMRRVVHAWARRPGAMVRVLTEDGESFACTPNHPLLTTDGWTPAAELAGALLLVADDADLDHRALRRVREADDHREEEPSGPVPQERASLLLGRLPGPMGEPRLLAADGQNEPQVRLGADAQEQPYGLAGNAGESGRHPAGGGTRAASARRERHTDPGAAAGAREGAGLGDGVRGGAKRRTEALPLQAGHRGTGAAGLRRGGRRVTRPAGAAGGRREAGPATARLRVVGVQILEPGRDGTYGGVCPDGLVYNLEVDTTHTYLIGRGLIAHNCHHAAARTYVGVMDYFGCYAANGTDTLGITATLARGDGVGLGGVWQEVAYERSLLEMIVEGYLVNPRGRRVEVDIDFSQVRTSGGDYVASELGEALSDAGFEQAITEAYLRHGDGRPGLVFTPTVATAQSAAEALRGAGVKAQAVWGEMDRTARAEAINGLRNGELDILCNCAVLTEGTDIPRAEVAIMARPTKSGVLHRQMVGRVLRTYPGKVGALVLDIVGSTSDHRLCTLLDLAEGEIKEKEKKKPEDEQQELFDGEGLVEAVERINAPKVRKVAATDVNLFASASPVVWLQTDGDIWFIPAGDGQVFVREWSMKPGMWVLGRMPRTGDPEPLGKAPDLTLAMALGEEHAARIDRAGGARFSRKNARWRDQEPKTAQLQAAERFGIQVPQGATSGEVSDMISIRVATSRIDRYFAKAAGRAPRVPVRAAG